MKCFKKYFFCQQVRGGSTGVPPPAPPALEEKRSPLQPQQQGRAQLPPGINKYMLALIVSNTES